MRALIEDVFVRAFDNPLLACTGRSGGAAASRDLARARRPAGVHHRYLRGRSAVLPGRRHRQACGRRHRQRSGDERRAAAVSFLRHGAGGRPRHRRPAPRRRQHEARRRRGRRRHRHRRYQGRRARRRRQAVHQHRRNRRGAARRRDLGRTGAAGRRGDRQRRAGRPRHRHPDRAQSAFTACGYRERLSAAARSGRGDAGGLSVDSLSARRDARRRRHRAERVRARLQCRHPHPRNGAAAARGSQGRLRDPGARPAVPRQRRQARRRGRGRRRRSRAGGDARASGGAGATAIGKVTEQPAGTVVLHTVFGGERIVDMLVGEQLPRIC